MPHEQQLDEIVNLTLLERLPKLVWQQITHYLDLKSKQQLRLSSKTNKKQVDDHFCSIHFKKQIQFSQFIKNPPSYPYIKSIYLSSDVTNFLFSYPYTPATANVSFFSGIKTHFPHIENIDLELRHFYMLLTLTNDPLFSDNAQLIKKLTVLSREVSLLTRQGIKKIKTKYDDILLSTVNNHVDIENNYNNRYLTQETLNLLKKFSSLDYLRLSLSDRVSCDYQDLAHLLQALPLLKTLDLDLHSELVYESEAEEFIRESKNYPVEESALKHYPNIRTLLLRG